MVGEKTGGGISGPVTFTFSYLSLIILHTEGRNEPSHEDCIPPNYESILTKEKCFRSAQILLELGISYFAYWNLYDMSFLR